MAVRTSAKERRKSARAEITLNDGSVMLARRISMKMMLIEGLIPMPLLVQVEQVLSESGQNFLKAGEMLSDEHRLGMIEMLRKHACAVAVEPVVVMKDDGNEDHLPVELLELNELNDIWKATAVVRQEVTAEKAGEFRPESQPVDDAVSNGESVPLPAEQLAGVDLKTG